MMFGEGENVRRAACLSMGIFDGGDDVMKIVVDFFRIVEASGISKAFSPLSPEEGGDCVICYDELKNGVGLKCAECRNVFHGGCLGAAGNAMCPFCRAKLRR